MQYSIKQSFADASYPCYFLANDGDFWHNNAAKSDKGLIPSDVHNLLAALKRGENRNPGVELPDIPLPADALRIQGLKILPVAEGVLAVAIHNLHAPISVLSGQVREPLADIFAVLPMLAKKLEDENRYLVDDIQKNGYRLLRIASNLESIGRAQKMNRSNGKALDLSSLVSSVCKSAAVMSNNTGVEIECETPDYPVVTICDTKLISESVLNLIRNSLQFTQDGNRIKVRLSIIGKLAVLKVEDKGLGIKSEHIARVFAPYFSADPYGDSNQRPGLGLGLSVVRETAYAFGGTVVAESRFGEGTVITLSLPVADDTTDVVGSNPKEYLSDKYSSLYVQLCGFCDMPVIGVP